MAARPNTRKPLHTCKRQSDNIPADTRKGYEKGVRNRNPKESGSKVKANAGVSPQGV